MMAITKAYRDPTTGTIQAGSTVAEMAYGGRSSG
jgi:hypothetical protein